MGYLAERVSYLRGLADGLSLNKETAESRLFDEIIELLDDIASSVEGLEEQQDDLADELSDMEESICDLEDEIYAEDYNEDDYVCEEISCPNCGTILPIDTDIFEEDEIHITCPTCGEDVTIELDDEDELCDDDLLVDCDGDCCSCCEDCDEE